MFVDVCIYIAHVRMGQNSVGPTTCFADIQRPAQVWKSAYMYVFVYRYVCVYTCIYLQPTVRTAPSSNEKPRRSARSAKLIYRGQYRCETCMYLCVCIHVNICVYMASRSQQCGRRPAPTKQTLWGPQPASLTY